jgi:hypothetical protein
LTGKKITAEDIAWLWIKMTRAFGHRFVHCYGLKDEGVWLRALRDLAPQDINFGFNRVLESFSDKERETHEVWPPNVKEFKTYCERKLSDYGLPDVNRAFIEYEKNEWRSNHHWSHEVVEEAARRFKPDPLAHRGENCEKFSVIYDGLVKDYLCQQE